MTTINITNTNGTNYSEIPTGIIEVESVEAFARKHALTMSGNTLTAEWGNGEGADEFEFAVVEGDNA